GYLTDVPASDTPETARQRSQSITIKTARLTPITGNASPSRRLIRNDTPLPHSGNASQLWQSVCTGFAADVAGRRIHHIRYPQIINTHSATPNAMSSS